MSDVASEPSRSSTAPVLRAWVTLFAGPLVLALAFLPFIVFFSVMRGLDGEALLRAVEGVAAAPASIACVALLLLTRFPAARDGIPFPGRGWAWPPPQPEG